MLKLLIHTDSISLIHLLLAGVLGVLSLPAHADFLHVLSGYECQPQADRLILTYDGRYNEEGEEMVANKLPTQYTPGELVTIADEIDEETGRSRVYLTEVRSAEGACHLSDGTYTITLSPNPGNSNILGLCGAWMGMMAKVEKDGKTIYETDFSDSCHVDDGQPTIRRVMLRPGQAIKARRDSVKDETQLGLISGAECLPEQDALVFSYEFGDYNTGYDQKHPMRRTPIEYLALGKGLATSCSLSDGDYHFTLMPETNMCRTVRLAVVKDGKTIHENVLGGECRKPGAVLQNRVRLTPGKPPEIGRIGRELFFDDERDYRDSPYPLKKEDTL